MSVDFYWRRVRAEVPEVSSPRRLQESVPLWSDDEFGTLQKNEEVLLVERHHALLDFLLKDAGAHDGRPHELPVFGGERRTEHEVEPGWFEVDVWVLDPRSVREAAEFLAAFPVEQRMRELSGELAEEARALGFSSPWDAEWQSELRQDLLRLRSFFAAAAEAGEAVLKVERD